MMAGLNFETRWSYQDLGRIAHICQMVSLCYLTVDLRD